MGLRETVCAVTAAPAVKRPTHAPVCPSLHCDCRLRHATTQRLSLSYTLELRTPLVPLLHGVDASPQWLVVGGLVFMPLSVPFLDAWFGRSRRRGGQLPGPLLAALNRRRSQAGEEVGWA